MELRPIDPKNVTVSFLGSILSGFAEGTFINVEAVNDDWSDSADADGNGITRVRSNDTRATLTLTLSQSSPSNDVLSAFLALDRLSGEGHGPLIIKDNNGTTVLFASEAWIVRPPAVSYSLETETREWEIRMADYSPFIGGNSA